MLIFILFLFAIAIITGVVLYAHHKHLSVLTEMKGMITSVRKDVAKVQVQTAAKPPAGQGANQQ